MIFFIFFRYIILIVCFLSGSSLFFIGKSKRINVKSQRVLFFVALGLLGLLVVGEPVLRTLVQHRLWANDPHAKFFLPPYQPWSYFMGYVFRHFWLWRLIGAGIAVVLFFLADRFIVRPSEGFRINRQEAGLIAFGTALAGWPYLLFYLLALFLLYFLILSFLTARDRFFSRKNAERFAAKSVPENERAGVPSGERESEFEGQAAAGSLGRPTASFRGESEAFIVPRFPIALPATLALLIIPFANYFLVHFGLTVLRVTNLSV